jgi:hypothetical protein
VRLLSEGNVMKDAMVLLVPVVVFGLGGAFMVFVGRRTTQSGTASMKWPTAPGRIVSSEVKRGAKGSARPAITYTYTVDGQTHTGTRVNFNAGHISLNDSNRLVSTYPADSDAIIFYNPADPSEAVLEAGAKGGLLVTIFGAVLLLLAVVALGFFITQAGRG